MSEDASGPRPPGDRVGLRLVLFVIGACAGAGAVLAGAWAAATASTGAIVGTALLAAALAGCVSALAGARLAEGLAGLRDAIAGRALGMPRSPFAEIQDLARLARAREREEEARRDRIERERADLAALLAAANEGILLVTCDGRITRANPAAARFLGLPSSAESVPVSSTVRSAPIRKAIRTALTSREPAAVEEELEGRRVFVLAQPAEHEGAVVSLVDLTDIRRLETARRDFVANASHELKTPLTSIRGYAETLLDESVPTAMRRRFLETIKQNAERLQRVVDDLLDLSRIEAGAWEPEARAVRVSESALDAWTALEGRAAEREVSLALDESADAKVNADPFALRQIFANLLANALGHSPVGTRVTIGVTPLGAPAGDLATPGQLEVRVRDEGSGIPTDALPRIFERFYRVETARTGTSGGTGLGLAIVKHLVEQMGGRVRAESELGRGTTVFFTLPAPRRPAREHAGSSEGTMPGDRHGDPPLQSRYDLVTPS